MRGHWLAALAAIAFAACAHAQSSAPGPFTTPAGTLAFTRANGEFVATLDTQGFDRFGAKALTHFDDAGGADDSITRMLVQTDPGPVLYDFRRRPPLVQRAGRPMTIRRVFWQGDEVVMQGTQGWFRFERGVLTKLQSSKSIYH
ncbi:hypothetical protein [Paraburkholderia sp. C35]|uniref:hypothetical protein n=1 Tax=Paraburkholderia sp. C35 TaxID=2126993 RepID=UPI000D693559|nr:hypothetical protein [Paraburkholderia sp. C35]